MNNFQTSSNYLNKARGVGNINRIGIEAVTSTSKTLRDFRHLYQMDLRPQFHLPPPLPAAPAAHLEEDHPVVVAVVEVAVVGEF